MVRVLKLPVVALPPPRRVAQAGLLALGRAAQRWALLLEEKRQPPRPEPVIEFGLIEVGGRMLGARYEDGRLVALLPGVGRL
jgi:hypothetical protein